MDTGAIELSLTENSYNVMGLLWDLLILAVVCFLVYNLIRQRKLVRLGINFAT